MSRKLFSKKPYGSGMTIKHFNWKKVKRKKRKKYVKPFGRPSEGRIHNKPLHLMNKQGKTFDEIKKNALEILKNNASNNNIDDCA